MARPFYALDTRWAAGIRLRNEKRVDSVYDFGSIVEQFQTHEREATAFCRLVGRHGRTAGRRAGRAASRSTNVASGSLVSDNPGAVLPPDRRLVYPWIGAEVIEDDFRADAQSRPDRTHRRPPLRLAREDPARRVDPGARLGPRRPRLRCGRFEGRRAGRGADAVLERRGDGPPRRTRAGEHLVQRRRAATTCARRPGERCSSASAPTAASTSTSTTAHARRRQRPARLSAALPHGPGPLVADGRGTRLHRLVSVPDVHGRRRRLLRHGRHLGRKHRSGRADADRRRIKVP